jgi:hypothetical protein
VKKFVRDGKVDPRLAIIRTVVEELEAKGIRYCHWKSNEHVLAAVQGDTDLDLLSDKSRQQEVVVVLNQVGFVRYQAAWYVCYPDIEDYLAVDPAGGKLVHIHAHFGLVLGEKLVKSYCLPWMEELLATRRWDEAHGIYCSDPVYELLLLFVRMALKRPLIPFLSTQPSPDAIREYAWSKKRVSLNEVTTLTRRLLGPQTVEPVTKLYQHGLTHAALTQLFAQADPVLSRYRRYGKAQAILVRLFRQGAWYAYRINRKLGLFALPVHRTLPGEGVLVALMGADGCGKSTQTKIIRQRFAAKVDVLHIYMGSGDGPGNFLRLGLDRIRKTLFRLRQQRATHETHSANANRLNPDTKSTSLIFRVGFIIRSLLLGWEKKSKLRQAARARGKGLIVICDRYPQTTIPGYNDGPLLNGYANSKYVILRRLAQWERNCYTLSPAEIPDLVIKLYADSAVLAERRPEMAVETIEQKQAGILAVEFPDLASVIQIDAGQTLPQVTAACMRAIAGQIAEKYLQRKQVGHE